ncbi:MAG: zf-HC2 domain-containing protein [Acidimicrobiia bacterium]
MGCNTIAILLSADLDDELTPDEQTILHHHLERCPACEKERRELLALQERIHACPIGSGPDQTAAIMASRTDARFCLGGTSRIRDAYRCRRRK